MVQQPLGKVPSHKAELEESLRYGEQPELGDPVGTCDAVLAPKTELNIFISFLKIVLVRKQRSLLLLFHSCQSFHMS